MYKDELDALLKQCQVHEVDSSHHKKTKNKMRERVNKTLFLQELYDTIDHANVSKEDYPRFPESLTQFCDFVDDEKALIKFGRTEFVKSTIDRSKILERERLELKSITESLINLLVECRDMKRLSATQLAKKLKKENQVIERQCKTLLSQMLALREDVKALGERVNAKDIEIESLKVKLDNRKASVHKLR